MGRSLGRLLGRLEVYAVGPSGVSGMHDSESDQTREYGHIQWMDGHFEYSVEVT
jgi:hypothetical protein